MTTRRKKCVQRFLKCPCCGKTVSLWAKNSRKKGHLKTMYCYYCNNLVNMIELDEYGLDKD